MALSGSGRVDSTNWLPKLVKMRGCEEGSRRRDLFEDIASAIAILLVMGQVSR